MDMIQQAIEKIVSKMDLTYDEAYQVMNEIMNGQTTAVQNAAFLAALSTKSTKAETIDEISGSAAAMRTSSSFSGRCSTSRGTKSGRPAMKRPAGKTIPRGAV